MVVDIGYMKIYTKINFFLYFSSSSNVLLIFLAVFFCNPNR